MRPEIELAGLLWDALEFARNARIAVGGISLEKYLEGGLVAWGTERQMELIGEVLSKLRRAAPEVAERVPNVQKIIGMRNILIHGYLVVNPRIVYRSATEEVPELIPVLEALLAEVTPPDELS
jgi:uncharacterized protein with HEPN domain